MEKLNAIEKIVKVKDLSRRGNGENELQDYPLTEHEITQVAIMLEKVNTLTAQLDQVNKAFSALIESIVTARKLDTRKFGVNLAAGKILSLK